MNEYSWEEDCANEYRLLDDEYEEPILIKQDFVDANTIICDYCVEPVFPWHRHTKQDFKNLNDRLQRCIPELMMCRDITAAENFIRDNEEIYNAYLQWPIQVEELSGQYIMMNDGRHRIWAAQQSNGLLPVRIVQYKRIHSMSIEEYTNCRLHDDWFYVFEVN